MLTVILAALVALVAIGAVATVLIGAIVLATRDISGEP